MTLYVIEPRDPLIARDGRPAGFGGTFSTLRFPTPSTIAGAARTRMASVDGAFACPEEELDRLLAIPVHGPLLAEIADTEGAALTWLAPAPRDAVLFSAEEAPGKGEPRKAVLRRLLPIEMPPGCAVDKLENPHLLLAGFAPPILGKKPLGRPPAFWRWDHYLAWLGAPQAAKAIDLQDGVTLDPEALGLCDLLRERRAHLAIQPGERVGVEGYLFQTEGLRFLQRRAHHEASRFDTHRLALTLRTPGGEIAGRQVKLVPEVAPLGGDRRLARWRAVSDDWPGLPEPILQSIKASRRARLCLLTPAAFSGGGLPGWNGEEIPGASRVKVRVRCACVPRAEVISGWDLRAHNDKGKPGRAKPTRRLAPAGSVYFVELEADDDEAVATWCKAVWLQPISDTWVKPDGTKDTQARRDGFGLAALGTWSEPIRKEPS